MKAPQSGWVVPITGAGAATVLFATALALISLRAANPWLLLVACSLAAPAVISQLLRPDLASISIGFRSPDRAGVGESVEQVFHAHNGGRRSSPGLWLTHSVAGFTPITLAVPPLPPGGRADLTVRRLATARGVAVVHQVQVQTTAPFGMGVHHRWVPVTARIVIHPAPGPVAVLPGVAHGSGSGGRPTRSGEEPHELREWRRGDSLRQVHWRATARHDRLTVVVPENTVRTRMAMVMIGPADPSSSDFEALVSTSAWTAVEAIRSDGVVRLSAAGNPDYTGDDPGAVLDWFAGLEEVLATTPEELAMAAAWAGRGGARVLAGARPEDLPAHHRPGTFLLTADGRVAPG